MSIPSQLPQFVTAARTGALQALALQSGQVLDAKIIGVAPNGGTQVEIRGQMLNLMLPMTMKPGETVRFEVQVTGQQLRLALQPATMPSTAPATSPAPAASGAWPSLPLPQQAAPPLPQQNGAVVAPTAQQAPAAPPPVVPSASPAAAQSPIPAPLTTVQAAPGGVPAPAPGQPAAASGPAAPATAPVPQAPVAVQGAPPVAGTVNAPAAAGPAPTAVSPTGQPMSVATPYPAAAPGAAGPVIAAPAAAIVPATAPTVGGAVRPAAAVTPVANATAHSSSGGMPQPQQQPMAATPQAALAQMVQASVPRQGSVVALTAALTSIAGKVALPEQVARAAQQVLAGRVNIDAPRFGGASLQAAVRGSGVFQEAALARGQLPLPQTDMKSALLGLRQTLTTWLGQQTPVPGVAPIPPPLRGSIPRARAGETPPPLDPQAAPEEVGKQLLERTESALSRVRLHQHASLPDPAGRTGDWSLDLPVMIGTQQTLMQMQIHRDQHNEADPAAERGWQMRFAISLPDMGEVGAQVTLRAGQTGVMLWATEPEASAALEAEIGALRETLATAGLRPGAVIVRHGEPPAPPAAPSGHFVDART